MTETLQIYVPPDSDKKEGDGGKKKDDPLTVNEVVDQYLGLLTNRGSPVAAKERDRVLDLFCAQFGSQIAVKLEPVKFLAWLKAQEGLKSDWTLHRWVTTIKTPLNWAAKYGIIPRNPLAPVSWETGPNGRSIKLQELLAMLRATTPIFRRILIALRCIGCRPQELCDLEWTFFDDFLGVFELSKHKTMRKTKRPRDMVMPDVVLKLLKWMKRHGAHDRWVFTNAYGRQLSPGAIQKRVRRLRQKLGLPDDLKAYGCRHAQISSVLINKGDLKTASTLAGHSSIEVTARVYAHLEGEIEHLRDGANKGAKLTRPKPVR